MFKTSVLRWLAMPAVAGGLLCLPALALSADHRHGRDRHREVIRHVEHERHEARFEHHAPWFRGPVHYDQDYFRHFRPAYRTMVIGPGTYYYYAALPIGCQTVVVGGQTYYLAGGVYYMPYPYAGGTVYLVVPPPV